jgi:hypothetical protein
VERTKTTVYLEPDLLTAIKALAASTGRREYEVVEDALRAYMRSNAAAAAREQLRTILDRWADEDSESSDEKPTRRATDDVPAV